MIVVVKAISFFFIMRVCVCREENDDLSKKSIEEEKIENRQKNKRSRQSTRQMYD